MIAKSNQTEAMSALDWYRLLRSRIEHEDNLVIQRLSWLVASQSFLFTAYSITTNGLSSAAPKGGTAFVHQWAALFQLIPLVAVSNAVLIYVSILAALKAIRELRHQYQARLDEKAMPALQTRATTRLLGLSAPLLVPLLFVAVWLFLFVHGHASAIEAG